MKAVTAVDLGGTRLRAASFDAQGVCLAEVEGPSHGAQGAAAVLDALRGALARLPDTGHLSIASAGVIDPASARVTDATEAIPGWAGTDLRAAFPSQQVAALNDVQAALLGELSARPESGCVVMLTLGTGLGGALAFDGRLHFGRRGLAGHFGRCTTAGQALESQLSGTGLLNLHRAHGGQGRSGEDVIALGDHATLARWSDLLAEQLNNLAWTLDPELVLLGGGLIDARDHWWDQTMAQLQSPLRVEAARLGTRAGLMGALAWAKESFK